MSRVSSRFWGLYNKEISLCEAGVGTGKTLGLPRGLYSLADEPSRTDETAYRYSTSSVTLQDAILTRVSARPVRCLADEGIITAPITAVVRKGKERLSAMPASIVELLVHISGQPYNFLFPIVSGLFFFFP